MSRLEQLSSEVLLYIFSHLELLDLLRMHGVSARFSHLISRNADRLQKFDKDPLLIVLPNDGFLAFNSDSEILNAQNLLLSCSQPLVAGFFFIFYASSDLRQTLIVRPSWSSVWKGVRRTQTLTLLRLLSLHYKPKLLFAKTDEETFEDLARQLPTSISSLKFGFLQEEKRMERFTKALDQMQSLRRLELINSSLALPDAFFHSRSGRVLRHLHGVRITVVALNRLLREWSEGKRLIRDLNAVLPKRVNRREVLKGLWTSVTRQGSDAMRLSRDDGLMLNVVFEQSTQLVRVHALKCF